MPCTRSAKYPLSLDIAARMTSDQARSRLRKTSTTMMMSGAVEPQTSVKRQSSTAIAATVPMMVRASVSKLTAPIDRLS